MHFLVAKSGSAWAGFIAAMWMLIRERGGGGGGGRGVAHTTPAELKIQSECK